MDRAEMVEKLKEGVYSVTFTKTDGSTRNMLCSLNPVFLPELIADAPVKAPNTSGPIAVWDIEAEGWRSFKPETVSNFEEVN